SAFSVRGGVLAAAGSADFGGGPSTLEGGLGNDTLVSDVGGNRLDGGGGLDTVDFTTAGASVAVDLLGGTAASGLGFTDTLIAVENVLGSAFGDDIKPGLSSGSLDGRGGADTLDYAGATAGATVDLEAGTATTAGGEAGVIVANFERVVTSVHD